MPATNSRLLSRITVRQDVLDGKPIARDMRISMEIVLILLAQGVTPEAIMEDYPGLEPDDVRACTACIHAVIAKDALFPISVADP